MDRPQQPLVVLVVEDEAILRLQAADALEEAGFRVVEAPDADAALEVLRNNCVEVLFTDIQMPGRMDGLELARYVHERWPDVRLVITSGRIRPTQQDLPDASAFIGKPYEASSLLNTVRKVAG